MHTKLLDMQKAKVQIDAGIGNEIFKYYYIFVSGFECVLENACMDGKWITPIVDLVCK